MSVDHGELTTKECNSADEKSDQARVTIEEIPRPSIEEEEALDKSIDVLFNSEPSDELMKLLIEVFEEKFLRSRPANWCTKAPNVRQQSAPIPAPRPSLATPSCRQREQQQEQRRPVPAPRKRCTLLNISRHPGGRMIDLAKLPPRGGTDSTELGDYAKLEFTVGFGEDSDGTECLFNQKQNWFDPLYFFNRQETQEESDDDLLVIQPTERKNRVLRVRKDESTCYVDLCSESDMQISNDEVQSNFSEYELSERVLRDIGVLNKDGRFKSDFEETFNMMSANISFNIRSPLFRRERRFDEEENDDNHVRLSDFLDAEEDEETIDYE